MNVMNIVEIDCLLNQKMCDGSKVVTFIVTCKLIEHKFSLINRINQINQTDLKLFGTNDALLRYIELNLHKLTHNRH